MADDYSLKNLVPEVPAVVPPEGTPTALKVHKFPEFRQLLSPGAREHLDDENHSTIAQFCSKCRLRLGGQNRLPHVCKDSTKLTVLTLPVEFMSKFAPLVDGKPSPAHVAKFAKAYERLYERGLLCGSTLGYGWVESAQVPGRGPQCIIFCFMPLGVLEIFPDWMILKVSSGERLAAYNEVAGLNVFAKEGEVLSGDDW